jgi:hypothetical protein
MAARGQAAVFVVRLEVDVIELDVEGRVVVLDAHRLTTKGSDRKNAGGDSHKPTERQTETGADEAPVESGLCVPRPAKQSKDGLG